MSTTGIKHKIPVFHTVKQAYSAAFTNLPTLIRIVWLWVVVMLPVWAIFNWLTWPWIDAAGLAGNVDAAQKSVPDTTGLLTQKGIMLVCYMLQLPFVSSVAVAWHRFVINGETISTSSYFRFDGLVWRYGLATLLLFFIVQVASAPMLIAAFFAQSNANLLALSAFLTLVLVYVAVLSIARLSVILPATALERQEISLASVWQTTKGNSWRMFFGLLLCAAPMCIVMPAITSYALSGSQLNYAIGTALSGLVGSVFIMVHVGFLSFAYRYFYVSDRQTQPMSFSEQHGPFGLAIR